MASHQEKPAEKVENKKPQEEEEDSSDDEHAHDHHGHDHDHEGHDHKHGDKKANKGEKKFKKAMLKFGLKPVEGINRVTIKKSKAFFLYIDDPEVLKSPGADNTYVVFGEAKIQDFSNLGNADEEARKFASEKPVAHEHKHEETKGAAEDDNEEVSEEGLDAATIEMVVDHTKCTRKEAVKALKATNGDSVTAIINLTK